MNWVTSLEANYQLHAASSWVTKGFTLLFSHMQLHSPRPVNTLECVNWWNYPLIQANSQFFGVELLKFLTNWILTVQRGILPHARTWLWMSLVCRHRNVTVDHWFTVKPPTYVKLPASLVSTGLIHHNLVVKVRYCRQLLKQSGSQAFTLTEMKPTHLCTLHLSHRLVHTVPLCRLDGIRTNVQTLHNNRRRVGWAQNLTGNLSHDSFGLFHNTSTS